MADKPIHKSGFLFDLILAVIMFSLGVVLGPKIFAPGVQFPPPPPSDSPIPSPPTSWANKANLPGNSFATAFNLVPGFDVNGSLNAQNVEDFYTFTVDHTSKVRLTGTNTPQDYRWYLYDSNYQLIASTVRSGVVEGLSSVVLQNPGRYYLRVIGKYSDANSLPYTIRLDISSFFN